MKRAIFGLIAGFLLVGIGASGTVASVVFQDKLDGSNLGKSSVINYGAGVENQAASFTNVFDYIRYDTSLIPTSGTLTFYVKPSTIKQGMLFTTVGMDSARDGDMTVLIGAQGNVGFWMFAGNDWNYLYSTQQLSANRWSSVAVSYGSQGMKVYVDGVLGRTLAYTGNRVAKDLFAGDYALDNAYGTYLSAFSGSIDNIRCSNIQSDSALLASPAAVPEPSALIALATGLVSALAAFKRRS